MHIDGGNFTVEVLARINRAVEDEPTLSRAALSRQVCEWLDWRAPNGRLKQMSCRVALSKLEHRGVIRLPPPRDRSFARRLGPTTAAVLAEPAALEGPLTEIGPVELIKIGSADSKVSRVWNELMRHHYLGSGPLCGAQMRYLIHSTRHGWLGGLSFSAAAWRIEARERWIGWTEQQRREHLPRVVCNSRFLILPQVRVPNLASQVLAAAAARLPREWRERYGYEPVLLETFVEKERFRGTCYRAAGWHLVGQTRGRGRQDGGHRAAISVKDIYLLPLRPDARDLLCSGVAQPVRERREFADWAQEEFAEAPLGDQRLISRLVTLARDLYAQPQSAIPQACQTRAKTKAAYRFFDHPETTMERLLAAHYEATVARVSRESVVLAVQDTTTLNYSAHSATEGLGPIGYRVGRGTGLVVHDTMAFSTEGTPLGLLDVQCWARDPEDYGKKRRRHQEPIEAKESNKWLISYRKAAEAQRRCPKTTLVSVGDREADIYELFSLALSDPKGPKLLVRAEQDRSTVDGQGHLWETLANQPVAGVQEIFVPRQAKRAARVARLQVRYAQVMLKPPQLKPDLGPLQIWAVLAQEVDVPADQKPLEWMLVSTMPVTDFSQAIEKLDWYTKRWGIEVYHRTLKSGCKIEERQLGHADRIEACLAIDMVVAWRIFHLVKLGRETPDVPCSVYFEDAEWKALVSFVTRNPTPPSQPPSLREAIRMVASLGGFLGRKCDAEPGTKSLWIGLQRLDDIAATWKYLTMQYAPHLLIPPVSSDPGYG